MTSERTAVKASTSSRLILMAGLVFAAAVGLWSCRAAPGDADGRGGPEGGAVETETHVEEDGTVWTCSMHPQIRQPEPGDCPICGMDLIPVEAEAEEAGGDRTLTVTESAAKLMQVQTTPAVRKVVSVEVPMVGMVAYDEGRVERVAAWVGGRIEKMHVDFVGQAIRAGEPMVDLYSPGLIAAQEELLGAARSYERARASGGDTEPALETLDAVRERLRQWGLTAAQVGAIEKRGEVTDTVTLTAPVSGTVVEKNETEGSYVKTGTVVYTIADLSVVWVELEAYESDLAWVRDGQNVTFTTEAQPGHEFGGTVAFIDPVVDKTTRTVGVRVEADNPDGMLKPGMFVRATARARYGTDQAPPLVIPASAPLLTGTRAVVYVQVPDQESPTYEGREVVLGPKAGDYYVVESGLHAGEQVVVEGAFKIDSALQIRAQPSMMNPGGDESGGAAHHHGDMD